MLLLRSLFVFRYFFCVVLITAVGWSFGSFCVVFYAVCSVGVICEYYLIFHWINGKRFLLASVLRLEVFSRVRCGLPVHCFGVGELKFLFFFIFMCFVHVLVFVLFSFFQCVVFISRW